MPRQARSFAVAAAFAVFAAALPALAAPEAATMQSLEACRSIKDVAARAACYDRVMDKASPGAAPTAQPPVVQLPAAAPPPAQAAAPQPQAAPPAADETTPSRGTFVVAKTGRSSNGKLRMVTSDGAVWEQTVGAPADPPPPGTRVAVRRNLFGGYFCKLDQWRSVRCERRDRPDETAKAPAPAAHPAPAAPAKTVMVAPSTPAPPPAAPAPAAPAQSAPPPQSPSRLGLPQQSAARERSRFIVVVASAGRSSSGKLRFVTKSGEIWVQTVGAPAALPKPGSAIEIRRNALGGHFCKVDKWHSVRCEPRAQ